jgi:hypothetical protein
METIIKTKDGVRVSLHTWDDDGAWLHLAMKHGTSYVVLTRNEAERLLAGLQALLTEEVAA